MKDFLFFLGIAALVAVVYAGETMESRECHAAGGRWVHRDGCASDYCEEPKK